MLNHPIVILFVGLFLAVLIFVLYTIHVWIHGAAPAGHKYLARERINMAERDMYWAMNRGDTTAMAEAQREYDSALSNARDLEELE